MWCGLRKMGYDYRLGVCGSFVCQSVGDFIAYYASVSFDFLYIALMGEPTNLINFGCDK